MSPDLNMDKNENSDPKSDFARHIQGLTQTTPGEGFDARPALRSWNHLNQPGFFLKMPGAGAGPAENYLQQFSGNAMHPLHGICQRHFVKQLAHDTQKVWSEKKKQRFFQNEKNTISPIIFIDFWDFSEPCRVRMASTPVGSEKRQKIPKTAAQQGASGWGEKEVLAGWTTWGWVLPPATTLPQMNLTQGFSKC